MPAVALEDAHANVQPEAHQEEQVHLQSVQFTQGQSPHPREVAVPVVPVFTGDERSKLCRQMAGRKAGGGILPVLDELGSHHDGGDEQPVGVPPRDAESRAPLAQPVDVHVGDDVDRWGGAGVAEDPLEEGLDAHVQDLVAVEGADPRSLFGAHLHLPFAAPSPSAPGDGPLQQGREDGYHQRGGRIVQPVDGEDVGAESAWRHLTAVREHGAGGHQSFVTCRSRPIHI